MPKAKKPSNKPKWVPGGPNFTDEHKKAEERAAREEAKRNVPDLPPEPRALLTADWHLSHKPPLARSIEEDWYAVMYNYLKQVKDIQSKHSKSISSYLPIIVAGDIFHTYKETPELVNFTLENIPWNVYAIPGNHDLPNHNYENIRKSSYFTLVKAGKVINLLPKEQDGCYLEIPNDLVLYSFPCGFTPTPLEEEYNLLQTIAVIHDFVWTQDTGYPDAPVSKRLKSYKNKLKGYDLAVIGDNHKSFVKYFDTLTVVNCGSLLRRNIDQLDYKPCVWLLMNDNSVKPIYLDTSKDKFLDTQDFINSKIGDTNIQDFIKNIKDLKQKVINFEEAVIRSLEKNNVSPEVKRIVLTAMEEA